MSNVWLVMPSKRPPAERDPILKLWKDQGYKVALWLDEPPEVNDASLMDLTFCESPYPGYAAAVNTLARYVLEFDPQAEWIVSAGDDTEPDMNHTAAEIAASCEEYFGRLHAMSGVVPWPKVIGVNNGEPAIMQAENITTFGVMQPTGDRWGEHRNTHQFTPRPGAPGVPQMCSQCGRIEDNVIHSTGAYIDRVAGSPWMGREFCLRVNQGKGPLWPEYFHMGCDEELQHVATRLGVFWQRRDLIHLHRHWGRTGGLEPMPDFAKRANSKEEWNKYKALFSARKAAGFPGSEPL